MRAGKTRCGTGGAGALLLLCACAHTPDEYTFTAESQAELGGPVAEYLDGRLPLLADTAIVSPVRDVGLDLAGPLGAIGYGFEFRVVDLGSVNAFSLPGGFVYVHRGLLEATKNMSEVAAVLSHEIAHVLAGHSAERLLHARRSRLGLTVASPWSDRSGSLFFAHHHRLEETEADSLAVGIMVEGGWDPSGLLSFFQSMLWLRRHRAEAVDAPFLSHPTLEERIAAVRRIIDRLPEEGRDDLRRFTSEHDALRDALEGRRPPGRRERR